jgi:hypothetical protein
MAVNLHITYFYYLALQISEIMSPTEKSFCMTEYANQMHAPVFSRTSENGFSRIHLLELSNSGGLTTQKTRDAFVRIKVVDVLCEGRGCMADEDTFNRSLGKYVKKGSRVLQMP